MPGFLGWPLHSHKYWKIQLIICLTSLLCAAYIGYQLILQDHGSCFCRSAFFIDAIMCMFDVCFMKHLATLLMKSTAYINIYSPSCYWEQLSAQWSDWNLIESKHRLQWDQSAQSEHNEQICFRSSRCIVRWCVRHHQGFPSKKWDHCDPSGQYGSICLAFRTVHYACLSC